jgi:hemoglobin
MESAEKPSLYDRLGGVYSIATVVDDFIDHRVPPAGFKYLVTEMVCWATGGPQKYTGKSMAESHSHLKITVRSGRHSWTIFNRRWINLRFPLKSKPN